MNDLAKHLNAYKTGCINWLMLLNHLMHADNLVIFNPYSGGLQRLLKIYSEYGIKFDIKYNATILSILAIQITLAIGVFDLK